MSLNENNTNEGYSSDQSERSSDHRKGGFEIVKKIFIKNAPLIVAFGVILQLILDVVGNRWAAEDRLLEQSRVVEVELIPYVVEDVFKEKSTITNNKGFHLMYEIYFNNDNVNDVNISNISFVNGTDYSSALEEENTLCLMENVPETMTLKSGSNYYSQLEIYCPLDYEQLRPLTLEEGDEANVIINDYLIDKFGTRDSEMIISSEDNAFRRILVSYVTDFDQKKHMVEFSISYGGMKGSRSGLCNNIAIEEAFEVEKISY